MGVPTFFRWLSRKYPSIVVQCDDGVKGQYHFDNLYLDMNGIIHPCSHPENKPPPENEEEMFLAIFEYIENIMKIVKPKKLLYMAIDGVAPRAKMNQQRSRRFRAAQDLYEKMIEIQKVKEQLQQRGIEVKEKKSEHFDSNVITPGTDFMVNLSEAIRTWINRKLSDHYNDIHGIWPTDLVVILSDASVPGEGEHKIMDYIRRQKADKNFNPNLSHCLYGADADLIMLGLATHEPNFTILREEFKPNQPKPCDLCGQIGHELKDCTGLAKTETLPIMADTQFIYIRLNVMREYLKRECNATINLDFERFIDDYVFLCFFVGNDFLPHLPSLEIRENAIDRLILIYKYVMEAFPDSQDMYLTKNGFVNKHRVQLVLTELGKYEDEIFQRRREKYLNYKEQKKRKKLFKSDMDLKWMHPEAISKNEKPEIFHNAKEEAYKVRMAFKDSQENSKLNKMLINPNSNNSASVEQQEKGSNKRKYESDDSDSDSEDPIQFHNEGWKERYYLNKFGTGSISRISKQISEEYFKGLCWVMLYYYQGCPDWKWFFPFHYSCFASDFKNIEQINVKFDSSSQPFKPLEQLMSVFPAASSKNLPLTWRNLMTSNTSPIIDFYPTTFRIDLNGKKASWMGVALLPFIDEERLLDALKNVYEDLNENERFRNQLGSHLIFTSKRHPFFSKRLPNTTEVVDNNMEKEALIPLSLENMNFISGSFKKSQLYSDIYNQTLCYEFYDPKYRKDFVFPAILLKNARLPQPVLKPQDLEKFSRYRPIIGMGNRQNNQAYLDVSGHRMIERSIQKNYEYRTNYTSDYHNQYGYQNYQYNQQQQRQSGNYGRYNNYQESSHSQQQQQRYSRQSNYSSYSYYQQSNYGPNYQQYYSGSYSNYQNVGPRNPQASIPSNISSYYTSDYVPKINNQQTQQRYNNNSHSRSGYNQ